MFTGTDGFGAGQFINIFSIISLSENYSDGTMV